MLYKSRAGAKVVKIHDNPATPHQRTGEEGRTLRNPFARGIDMMKQVDSFGHRRLVGL